MKPLPQNKPILNKLMRPLPPKVQKVGMQLLTLWLSADGKKDRMANFDIWNEWHTWAFEVRYVVQLRISEIRDYVSQNIG